MTRKQYTRLNERNFQEFSSSCKLFLLTLNEMISKENKNCRKKKHYKALSHKIIDLIAQTENKFLKQKKISSRPKSLSSQEAKTTTSDRRLRL